jgi:hypothetical protein
MAFSFGNSIITDSLITYVDIANPRSYVSGSTQAKDISGNTSTYIVNNNPLYNTNPGNLTFNGSNQYLSNLTNTSGTNNDNYTISTWFKLTQGSDLSGCQIFTRGRDENFVQGFGWSLTLGTFSGYYGTAITQTSGGLDNSYFTVSIEPISEVNIWVNLTGVYIKNNSINLYVNGVYNSTTTVEDSPLRSTDVTQWSIASIQNIQYANCIVSNAMAYNRALSASEILQNYNALKGRFGL